jgi:putative Ca2+/H+ antiporter (TMEM165/GDT1 family)
VEFAVVVVTAFFLVMPVELPDKTFVATLVLSTRYPATPVWLGVIAAFGVQCAVAVGAGHLLGRLPQRPVTLVAAGLFAVGALVMLRGARRAAAADAAQAAQEREYEDRLRPGRQGWRAAAASFAVLFTAEWGDLSQLLAAGLVASGKPAVPVFLGSWAALATVSGVAVLLGHWLTRRVRLAVVHYLAAGVCGMLAVVTAVSAW